MYIYVYILFRAQLESVAGIEAGATLGRNITSYELREPPSLSERKAPETPMPLIQDEAL